MSCSMDTEKDKSELNNCVAWSRARVLNVRTRDRRCDWEVRIGGQVTRPDLKASVFLRGIRNTLGFPTKAARQNQIELTQAKFSLAPLR